MVQSSAGNAAAEQLWGAGGSSTCPTAPQQILSLLGAAFVLELTQLPEEYPLPGATQPLTVWGMRGWSHLVRGALLVSCLTRFPVVLPFSVTAGGNREDKRGEILLIGCPGSFSVLPEGIWGGGGCLS